MRTNPQHQLSRIVLRLAAVVIALHLETRPASAIGPDEVINWNVIATSVALPGGQNAIQQSRTYAMVQLAVHDALNAIDRRYTPYAYAPTEDPTASAPAAVSTAAHDVLLSQVPAQAGTINAALTTSLSLIPDGAAKDAGMAIGHASAAAMLALRATDGSSVVSPYTPGTLPGQWQPTPNPVPPSPAGADLLPAILPGWGNVTPFALRTAAQFRPDGPPLLTSDQYTQDFDEVKAMGEQFSGLRTVEQSTIARFWYEGSPNMWNRITRTIAVAHSLDSWDNARVLALVNVAMADGFIAGFNAKYYFNFRRPVTAIRAADADGNDDTVSDLNWNTFLNTPAIPDYPSTHSVLGGAAAEVLARYFGTDDIAFTVTSGVPFAGITRSFASLSQAAEENADSRVFAGSHFRSACRDGVQQRRKIGKFTFMHYLDMPK